MSSTEVVVPTQLVDIRTGELVPATAEAAAELIQVVRDMRSRMLDLVKDCEAVLLEESRRLGSKTLHLEHGTAEISGGQDLAWDLDELTKLLDVGLPPERLAQLVVATVTYKVNARVAKQLEAANPDYAEIIGRARSYTERPWRVSVK